MKPAGDPTREWREGPTPNGGVRAEAFYRDRAGNLSPKSRATRVELVGYNADGREVHRIELNRGPGGLEGHEEPGLSPEELEELDAFWRGSST